MSGFEAVRINIFYGFIYFFLTLGFAQIEKVDLFITQNPEDFIILNRYQQKLSGIEKSKFLPFIPWEIVEKEMLLGDQFTKAMHVNFNGANYFITLTESDKPQTTDGDSYYQIIENCDKVNDKIEIMTDNRVLYRQIPFSSSQKDFPRSYVAKGVQFSRLFKKGRSYLVYNEPEKYYGWIRIDTSSSVIIINNKETEKTQLSISDDILTKVEAKVTGVNTVYQKLFAHLNSIYGKNLAAPEWEIVEEDRIITLTLRNINPAKIKRCVAYLVNDLENLITDQSYSVSSSDNKITLTLD